MRIRDLFERFGGRWLAGAAIAAVAALLALPVGEVRAQAPPSTDGEMVFARKGSGTPITDGHGWLVTREGPMSSSGGGAGRIVLHHLPPRLGDAVDLGGVVRRVISLETVAPTGAGGSEGGIWGVSGGGVDGIAWTRNRVYLLMPEEVTIGASGQEGRARRVLMVSAIHGAGTVYEYLPTGRMAVRASLPGSSQGTAVVGFAAIPGTPPRDGVCALVVPRSGASDAKEGVSGAELWVMEGEKWVRANAPWESGRAEGEGNAPRWRWRAGVDKRWSVEPLDGRVVQLLEWRDGVAITEVDAGRDQLTVWVGTVTTAVAEADRTGALRMEWTRQTFPLRGLLSGPARSASSLRMTLVQGKSPSNDMLVGLASSAGEKSVGRLVSLRATGPVEIASLGGVPAGTDVVPMAAPGEGVNPAGRLAMIWNYRSAERADRTLIREFSAASGTLLYDGKARADEKEERRRLQAVGVVGVLMAVGVLVLSFRAGIVRRAFAPPAVQPAGRGVVAAGELRVADPLRRLAAAVLDYAPSAVVVALLQGRDAVALLMPSTMFGGAAGLASELDLGPFAIALAVTVAHTSILEWLFGRSVGKFVLGVRVVDARAGVEGGRGPFSRPSLWQTLVRNVVRWAAPLLAVFALLDEAGRHPGDLAGQTLVVADPNDGT